MRFKWWFVIEYLFLNLPGDRTHADVAARLYSVTCLLGHLSQEGIVTWHMLNACSLPMRFKWWFLIDDLFLNLPGSRTCADVAARLYWVTCLLGHFSKEGTVTQHMQGTWPMPGCCKCWVVIRENILNARGSMRSPDIAARLYWLTCLLGNFSKEGTVTQHMHGIWLMSRYFKCRVAIRGNFERAG